MRDQLWRFFPAMLELADDLAAEWFLQLLESAPTPDEGHRLRQAISPSSSSGIASAASDAAEAWSRGSAGRPSSAAADATEAATAHIRTLISRLHH